MKKLMSKENEQKYIDKFKQDKDFYSVIQDIAENEVVLRMRDFCQHGDTSTYLHCLNVSYALYNVCKKKNLDYVSAARAAGAMSTTAIKIAHIHAHVRFIAVIPPISVS